MNRHYCTICGKKVSESKMRRFYYFPIKRDGWHCIKCLSSEVDTYIYDVTDKEWIEPSKEIYRKMLNKKALHL